MMRIKEIFKSDWIAPFLRKYRGGLILAVLLGTITMLCAGLLMFSGGYVISKSASKPENILMIYIPVLFVRIFGISRPVLRYIERLTSHNWIFHITSTLRRKLYLRLEAQAIALANRHRLGDLLGVLNEDIANLQDLYLRTLFPMLIAGSLTLAILISAGVFSLVFALGLALIFGLLYLLIPYLSVRWTMRSDRALKEHRNQLFSDLTDDILGLQDWTLSGREADFLSSYRRAENSVHQEQTRLQRFARWRSLIIQAVFGILVLYLMFWSSATLRAGDAPNYIAAVALCAFPFFESYTPLSEALIETNRYADSAARLDKFAPLEESEPERTQKPMGSEIVLSNLSFAFEAQPILKTVNLTIHPGEHLAVLGRSGAGKSTLASLIRGDLAPQEGQLTVGGVEASRALDIDESISVIAQNPYLFHTSLRNNLALANLDVTDSEIWAALEIVDLADMVRQLPGQLETEVDEAGLRFSGGERHRLALAQVLLKNTPIVILDEATVGLDPITENQVLAEAFELLKDKTLIFITHHLLGVSAMDRVIFLENGKIKIDGQPAALAEIDTHYQRLLQLDRGF